MLFSSCDHGNAQFPDPFVGQGHIDNSSTMLEHVINDLGCHLFRGDTKETVAVGPLLVHQDDHPTRAQLL